MYSIFFFLPAFGCSSLPPSLPSSLPPSLSSRFLHVAQGSFEPTAQHVPHSQYSHLNPLILQILSHSWLLASSYGGTISATVSLASEAWFVLTFTLLPKDKFFLLLFFLNSFILLEGSSVCCLDSSLSPPEATDHVFPSCESPSPERTLLTPQGTISIC